MSVATLAYTASTTEAAVVLDDALLVECGFVTVCEQRGSHSLVNTVGRWLDCEDCGYLTEEDYGCECCA